jgi:hypothetical protein
MLLSLRPMGLMKRLLELDWTPIGKAICADCLTSPPLRAIAEENLDEEDCEYCGRTAGEPIAVNTDILMEHIDESLKTEWTDPANVLAYETAEGGYQGEWCDTDDLLLTIGEEIGSDEFVQDVVTAYGDYAWCDRDYYGGSQDEALTLSWDRFADLVKYRSRYVFMRLPDDSEFPEHNAVEPAQMLSTIGELVAEMDLLTEIPAGTPVYRARVHARNERVADAEALGPPPREFSRSGRMSPAGIRLFYGAMDAETAMAEVWEGSQAGKEVVSIGLFTTVVPIPVVDLARLPDIPSIFDAEHRDRRPPLRFLHQFSRIISDPVNRPPGSEQEAVEYVPSQIVTDYFRNLFQLEHARPVKGLLYRSARREHGTCCALFVGHEECLNAGSASRDEGALLVLEQTETRSS